MPDEGERGPITAARVYAGHLSQLHLQCFSALSVGLDWAGLGIPHTRVYEFAPGVSPEDRSLSFEDCRVLMSLLSAKQYIQKTFLLWVPPVNTTISDADLFTPCPSVACMNPLKIQQFQPNMNSTFFKQKSFLNKKYFKKPVYNVQD